MRIVNVIVMFACFLFIAVISSSCITNKSTVSGAQLETFMATWSEYKAFHAPMEPKDEPLLLAALEKDPKGPWASYFSMKFAQAKFEARELDAADRTAHYKAALGYLEPACAILAKALETSPQDKELQQSLDMMKGLVSQAALEAGFDLATVKANAEAALTNNIDKKSWNYGNKIYKHHTSLGRTALRKGNIEEAKMHLHAAGSTPGSPQLNSYGPNFVLARELAEQGEYDAVIAFLDESVLNSPQPMFSEWPRRPLQEEIFGGFLGGEAFFDNLEHLLNQPDSEELGDLIEVYLLCLSLGFQGRYAAGARGELDGYKTRSRDKVVRIRGAWGDLSPSWRPPPAVDLSSGMDRVTRWMVGSAAAVSGFFGLLWLIFFVILRLDKVSF